MGTSLPASSPSIRAKRRTRGWQPDRRSPAPAPRTAAGTAGSASARTRASTPEISRTTALRAAEIDPATSIVWASRAARSGRGGSPAAVSTAACTAASAHAASARPSTSRSPATPVPPPPAGRPLSSASARSTMSSHQPAAAPSPGHATLPEARARRDEHEGGQAPIWTGGRGVCRVDSDSTPSSSTVVAAALLRRRESSARWRARRRSARAASRPRRSSFSRVRALTCDGRNEGRRDGRRNEERGIEGDGGFAFARYCCL